MKKNTWMEIRTLLIGLAITLTPFLSNAAIDFNAAVGSSGIEDVFTNGIIPACLYLGGAIVLFGAIQMAFAFRSDDADGKTKAMRVVVSGALLAGITGIATFGIDTTNAENIFAFVKSACTYIGAAIILFGAIQLAYAFRSDDAEGKNKGLRNAVAGALVAAVGAAGGGAGADVPTDMDTAQLNPLVNLIGTACIWIGAAITLFGAIQIAYAYRSEEADAKAKGMRAAIAGVLVLAVGFVIQNFAG